MGIRAINLSQTFTYVSDNDPDKGTEDETKFVFKALDQFQISHLNDMLMGFEQGKGEAQVGKINIGRVSLAAVQMSLQSASNFYKHDGEPIVIEQNMVKKNIMGRTYSVVSDDLMGIFPGNELQAMYQLIQAKNGMTPDDAKNLEAA